MSDYTDGQGKVYTVQEGYSTGDVVILSDNAVAWWVQKDVLAGARQVATLYLSSAPLIANSSVFKDMLTGPGSDNQELKIPDVADPDLSYFIDAIHQRFPSSFNIIPYSYHFARNTIMLAMQYDCAAVASTELFRACQKLSAAELFDAFVMASRLNSIGSACRILAQGYKSYGVYGQIPQFRSLYPSGPRVCWGSTEAQMIRPDWIWALTTALERVRIRAMEFSQEQDWDPVQDYQEGRLANWLRVYRSGFDFFAANGPAADEEFEYIYGGYYHHPNEAGIAALIDTIGSFCDPTAYHDLSCQAYWRMLVGEFLVNLLQ